MKDSELEVEYILNGKIWKNFNIVDIDYKLFSNKDCKIFETNLYFNDSIFISVNSKSVETRLYFTRYLNINELQRILNFFKVKQY